MAKKSFWGMGEWRPLGVQCHRGALPGSTPPHCSVQPQAPWHNPVTFPVLSSPPSAPAPSPVGSALWIELVAPLFTCQSTETPHQEPVTLKWTPCPIYLILASHADVTVTFKENVLLFFSAFRDEQLDVKQGQICQVFSPCIGP